MSVQPFELVFYTKKAVRTYTATYDGAKYTNCRPAEDGGVVVFFDNHKLGIGALWVDVHVPLTDKDFSDGVCNYRSTEPTGIVLDKGVTDDLGGFEVDVFPFYKQGEDGKDGVDGKDGADGAKGDKGDQGDKGEPFTYDDFTSEQLASLKGPKGEKGDTGAQGIQGPKGEDGAKGDKGDRGEQGPQGPKGDQGIQGEKGEDGKDGKSLTYYDLTEEDKEDLASHVDTSHLEIYVDQAIQQAITNTLNTEV